MQLQIAPSILAADFSRLSDDIRLLNSCADLIHLDIMDGSFVPNISFGFPVIESIAPLAAIPMDAHFMVVEPWKWVEKASGLGISMMSFHLEACRDRACELLENIRSKGMKAGIAVNPDIPVEDLFPYIGKADYFLVMSVFAGFGGQAFIPESLARITALRAELNSRGDTADIEVDGGINASNAAQVIKAGANILVAGSSVFRASDPAEAVGSLRNSR